MKVYGLVIGAVTELAVTVLLLMYAGQKADEHFKTGSKCLIAGTVVGIILGFTRLIIRLKGSMDDGSSDGKSGGSKE